MTTQSFCSEDLTRRLGIYGKKDAIRLTTLEQKEVQVNTSVVHLQVADLVFIMSCAFCFYKQSSIRDGGSGAPRLGAFFAPEGAPSPFPAAA